MTSGQSVASAEEFSESIINQPPQLTYPIQNAEKLIIVIQDILCCTVSTVKFV